MKCFKKLYEFIYIYMYLIKNSNLAKLCPREGPMAQEMIIKGYK